MHWRMHKNYQRIGAGANKKRPSDLLLTAQWALNWFLKKSMKKKLKEKQAASGVFLLLWGWHMQQVYLIFMWHFNNSTTKMSPYSFTLITKDTSTEKKPNKNNHTLTDKRQSYIQKFFLIICVFTIPNNSNNNNNQTWKNWKEMFTDEKALQ